MANGIEKFKLVLSDTETIIKGKIESLLQRESTTKEEIDPVILFCQETAMPFYHPRLHLIDFDFDEAKIRQELILFSTNPINTPEELKEKVVVIAQVFQDAGLKKAIEDAGTLIESVINERILSEETVTRRCITRGCNRVFQLRTRTDEELKQDASLTKFRQLRKQHLPIRKQYREALKNGLIQGLEGDVQNIKHYGTGFNSAREKTEFVKLYEHYTDFISQKVKLPEEKQA